MHHDANDLHRMHGLSGLKDAFDNGRPFDADEDLAAINALGQGIITQDGVAQVFALRYGGLLRFDHTVGAWFEWTGVNWRKHETDLARHYVRTLARKASDGQSKGELREARRITFVNGVEMMARGDPAIAVTSSVWDANPFLLGTPGGTVDLTTGTLRQSRPEEGVVRLTAVSPAATADCPLWHRFLAEATGQDEGLIRFLQQWFGYSLTGDIREHALVFVFGPGGNGKSVLLNTVTRILGDYAAISAMDTFTASRSDKHPTDLAMLRGARLVTASETEEGRAWAESRIKQMTGADPITARFMRQDFFTYRPQFKLIIIGNHKPLLVNIDDAARRRFNIVPFIRKPSSPDRQLEEKLEGEWPGILRWMIDGCLDWQANGLIRPGAVRVATEDYFETQDVFGHWLEEECDTEPGNEHKWEATGELFAAWQNYALRGGEQAGSQKNFHENMVRRGFEPGRKRVSGRPTRVMIGIRLSKGASNARHDE